jgi:quercetin dioxygenase-like cupin family protein
MSPDSGVPRVLGNADALVANPMVAGALWRLEPAPRHLDANIIHLPAGDRIQTHTGPDLDVLLLILDGAGTVEADDETLTIGRGDLVWLPRRSRRSIVAGASSPLTYFSVHAKRPPLTIGSPPPEPASLLR